MASIQLQKTCPRCKTEKPLEGFALNKSKRDGHSSYCKDCMCAAQKEHVKTPKGRATHNRSVSNWLRTVRGKAFLRGQRVKHREKIRTWRLGWLKTPTGQKSRFRARLKAKYRLTLDEYQSLIKRQGGLCAICGRRPPVKQGRHTGLVIDHDHKTGLVRGLLCQRCNYGLGVFRDDPALFLKVIDYLASEVTHG
jgi:hypothetical protein